MSWERWFDRYAIGTIAPAETQRVVDDLARLVNVFLDPEHPEVTEDEMARLEPGIRHVVEQAAAWQAETRREYEGYLDGVAKAAATTPVGESERSGADEADPSSFLSRAQMAADRAADSKWAYETAARSTLRGYLLEVVGLARALRVPAEELHQLLEDAIAPESFTPPAPILTRTEVDLRRAKRQLRGRD